MSGALDPERRRAYQQQYWAQNRERLLARLKEYRETHRDQLAAQRRERGLRIKAEVFRIYGGAVCTCCGETELAFLTLDHVHGGGTQHRKHLANQSGMQFYRWLMTNGYPDQDRYRVLCFNCNSGRHINGGLCPHEEKLRETLEAVS